MPSQDRPAQPIALAVPPELLDALLRPFADHVAALVADRLPEPAASPYLTTDEAAAYLRASKQRVFDLTSQGRLPVCKDGSRSLYRREDLDRYLRGADA